MNLLSTPTLVSKPENIYYHTGFIGSFGLLILKKTAKKLHKHLITDSRYAPLAKKLSQKHNFTTHIIEDFKVDFTQILKKLKITELNFESQHFSYQKFLFFQKTFKFLKLKPLTNELDLIRTIKQPHEIKKIIASQRLNEKLLTTVQKLLKTNITEFEIAQKIKIIALELQADDLSFDPIVAFGKNSACPHHKPTNKKLTDTDLVLIDLGVKYQHYCSDMTRTFLPKNCSAQIRNTYQLVLQAQENCLKNIKAGLTGVQADLLSRKIFQEAKLSEHFTHANGHGIGLEIHEPPSLSFKKKHLDKNVILQEDMIVTVEPGLYFEGKFGIRIEDMVLIKKTHSLNLTKFDK